MRLKCLGSGSSGNCYILENEKEALILDCGVAVKDIKIALNFDISKIVGAVVTHEHKDHSKSAEEISKMGIPLFYPSKKYNGKCQFGEFKIYSFKLEHDVDCYGFYIKHPDFGNLVYVTDTEFCRYTFADVNHFLVSANYDNEEAEIDPELENHIYRGHMSLNTALEFIKANYKSFVTKTITLCHLSERNADAVKFAHRLEESFDAETHIAYRGLNYEL